jgi:hypothetical protein
MSGGRAYFKKLEHGHFENGRWKAGPNDLTDFPPSGRELIFRDCDLEARLVVSLVNGPRAKVDLIEFRGSKEDEWYFFLRKMVFKAPGNVEGFEIKLTLEAAALLRVSLKRELEPTDAIGMCTAHPGGPHPQERTCVNWTPNPTGERDPQAQDSRPHAVRSA